MGTSIEAKALRDQDLFELPNGSVYETLHRGNTDDPVRARLWCAHPPDPITFAPPQIDFPPEQQVWVLNRAETRVHIHHAGYVRAVSEREMDRHHEERMTAVYENINREDAATRQMERASRPWWQRLIR